MLVASRRPRRRRRFSSSFRLSVLLLMGITFSIGQRSVLQRLSGLEIVSHKQIFLGADPVPLQIGSCISRGIDLFRDFSFPHLIFKEHCHFARPLSLLSQTPISLPSTFPNFPLLDPLCFFPRSRPRTWLEITPVSSLLARRRKRRSQRRKDERGKD